MNSLGDEAIKAFEEEIMPYLDNGDKAFFVALLKKELLKEQDVEKRYGYYAKLIRLMENQSS